MASDKTYNNSLGKEGSEVVIVIPADTFDCKGDVGSGNGVVTKSDLRANEFGLALLLRGDSGGSRRGRGSGQAAKVLLS